MHIIHNNTMNVPQLTNKLPPLQISADIISDFERLQQNKKRKSSLGMMLEDSFSIFSKDTRSSSSLDLSDAISTNSSENLEETYTVLNAALNEKKKSQTDETKFKTEICKNWSESGQCPYGKKCKFAHGKRELNEKKVSNKTCYKTKKCNSFHNKGMCMYGVRCLFAHEARPLQTISNKSYYGKYMCCPELLLDSKTTKKDRLPVFGLMAKEEKGKGEELVCQFGNEEEEFGYFVDSFRAEKYLMFWI